jgi:hypothetical protein
LFKHDDPGEKLLQLLPLLSCVSVLSEKRFMEMRESSDQKTQMQSRKKSAEKMKTHRNKNSFLRNTSAVRAIGSGTAVF